MIKDLIFDARSATWLEHDIFPYVLAAVEELMPEPQVRVVAVHDLEPLAAVLQIRGLRCVVQDSGLGTAILSVYRPAKPDPSQLVVLDYRQRIADEVIRDLAVILHHLRPGEQLGVRGRGLPRNGLKALRQIGAIIDVDIDRFLEMLLLITRSQVSSRPRKPVMPSKSRVN